jgi:Tol biopolymer transport system component
VRDTRWAENSYRVQLWLANTGTGEIVRLTNSKGTNRLPAWSPDGRWLAFISSSEGSPQIHVMSPSGGDERQMTNVNTGVSDFSWAPDSSRIAFSASDSESRKLTDRREKYSDFEAIRHDYTMTHLWVSDINGGAPRRLTGGNQFTVGSFSWSPDARQSHSMHKPSPGSPSILRRTSMSIVSPKTP